MANTINAKKEMTANWKNPETISNIVQLANGTIQGSVKNSVTVRIKSFKSMLTCLLCKLTPKLSHTLGTDANQTHDLQDGLIFKLASDVPGQEQ